MQIENLSWFPGHMTKTKRMIASEIQHMDAVCEILDARIPLSSRNPDVDDLTAGKPRLIVLNRADQADPAQTRRWSQYFRAKGWAVLEANAKGGVGTEKFAAAVRELLRDKLEAYAAKGQVGRVVRVMVLGIPNVGKSTFINKVAKRKTAKAEDRPGVTRSKQWVSVDATLELLDTPGILDQTTFNNYIYNVSSNFIEDGSYLRMSYVTLAYDFSNLMKRLGSSNPIKGLKCSLTGRNLFLLTKYTGADPQVMPSASNGTGSMGIDNYSVPSLRSFNFNVNVTF